MRKLSPEFAMEGAGNPAKVLEAYGISSKREKVPLDDAGQQALAARVEAHINSGRPVIVGLKSGQVSGWAHAVAIVGATRNGLTFAYKDPAHPRPNDPKYLESRAFWQGFLYTNHWHTDIYAYGGSVIFVGGDG